jgi:hypothetical protein
MAGEVQAKYETGRSLYYHIRNRNSLIYNGSSFEAYNSSNYLDYSLPLSEQGISGFYAADFPTIDSGIYFLLGYEQSGNNPSEEDRNISGGSIHWDGTEEIGFSDTPTDIHINGYVDDSSPTTESFNGNTALSSTDNFYNGGIIVFVSGSLKGIARKVGNYIGATRNFTLSNPMPAVPSNGDRFRFLGRIE